MTLVTIQHVFYRTTASMLEPKSPQRERMDFKEPHTGLVKKDFLGYWYLQYCLVTGLYMLEPWERKILQCHSCFMEWLDELTIRVDFMEGLFLEFIFVERKSRSTYLI
uniref:Histone acetyltransferase n=1 Tax=Globodera pallida TaxID=36090 RepID=A0A183BIC5_GLOPA